MLRTRQPDVGCVLYFAITIVINLVVFGLRTSAQDNEAANVSSVPDVKQLFGKLNVILASIFYIIFGYYANIQNMFQHMKEIYSSPFFKQIGNNSKKRNLKTF